MQQRLFRRIWGEATAVSERWRRVRWVDLVVVVSLVGLVFGLKNLAGEWTKAQETEVAIDLSPLALPRYTFYSLMRGLIAYVLSLLFTLLYGYWAAKDRVAERVLVPLLDILQSIPVLAFLPGLTLALVALFPSNNVGLELVAIITIFTGQAWNMTFSFYHSVRSVPADMREVATVYRYDWWQRFKWLELPFSMVGLVWNSMMSMAGGWFFLMVTEAFTLGDQKFRLPGVGAYMKLAAKEHDVAAMLWAIFAMVLMIVVLDQLLWRPIVVWAQKFRIEEGGQQEEMHSWFLDLLRRSGIVSGLGSWVDKLRAERAAKVKKTPLKPEEVLQPSRWATWLSRLLFVAMSGALLAGGIWLVVQLLQVQAGQWLDLVLAGLATMGRVVLSTGIATVLALPAGLAIGLSPKLSRLLQPVVQVVASFPSPMLYTIVLGGLALIGMGLNWGSILLMLLGTIWYILFNVIAGAMAIPADLKEAAQSYRLRSWQRFWTLYFPATFPYLVTGWVTAAGGAWNASIISEYISEDIAEGVPPAFGLGARITQAAETKDFTLLAASVLVMSALVVLFNRLVWKRCYHLAETRYSLEK